LGVAQLAVEAAAPRPGGSVARERERMKVAGSNRHDSGETRHSHRQRARVRRAVTELAEQIVAPCPYAAVAIQRERMVPARGDGDNVAQTKRANRTDCAVALTEKPVAQLAERAGTP